MLLSDSAGFRLTRTWPGSAPLARVLTGLLPPHSYREQSGSTRAALKPSDPYHCSCSRSAAPNTTAAPVHGVRPTDSAPHPTATPASPSNPKPPLMRPARRPRGARALWACLHHRGAVCHAGLPTPKGTRSPQHRAPPDSSSSAPSASSPAAQKKSQGRDLEAPPRWMETRPSLDLADFQPLPIQRLAFHATSPHSSPPGAAPNTATTCALDLEPQRLAFHATSLHSSPPGAAPNTATTCAPGAPRQGPLLYIPPIQSGARRLAPRGGGS